MLFWNKGDQTKYCMWKVCAYYMIIRVRVQLNIEWGDLILNGRVAELAQVSFML